MAEKKVEEKPYQLKEVPTQMGIAIVDKEGKELGQMDVLLEILIKLDKIERSIA